MQTDRQTYDSLLARLDCLLTRSGAWSHQMVSNCATTGKTDAMRDPLDAEAMSVPSVGRRQLVLVDGRTFAISDEAGQMEAGTHGLVHDDLRHLCRFELRVVEADLEVLAANAP